MALLAILAAAPVYAQQSFDNVAGSWSGGGMMKPSDGPRERPVQGRLRPQEQRPVAEAQSALRQRCLQNGPERQHRAERY